MAKLRIKLCDKFQINYEEISVVYRYFTESSHRDNFLKGNIWFAGVNQNRYEHNPIDPMENCYKSLNGAVVGVVDSGFALSFSKEYEDNQKYWIKINDVKGFMHQIVKDLRASTNEFYHEIFWLDNKELPKKAEFSDKPDPDREELIQKYGKPPPIINRMKTDKFCPEELEKKQFELKVYLMEGIHLTYIDKKLDQPLNNIPHAGRCKDHELEQEKEYRISFGTCDFPDQSYNGCGLRNLVKHIELHCAGIKEYCEKI